MKKVVIGMLTVLSIGAAGENSQRMQLKEKGQLLSGSEKKIWILSSRTPDQDGSCSFNHSISTDNSYIFFINGTFEFDHGAIVEDPDCEGEDCCSDIVNSEGKWEFTNSQRGIRIWALSSREKPELTEKLLLFNGTIVQLEDNVFKISQLDTETNVRHVYEFRKK